MIPGFDFSTHLVQERGRVESGSLAEPDGFVERLLSTDDLRYFLHGRGGPETQWGRSNGDVRTSGEGIKQVNQTQAQAWCDLHGLSCGLP